MKSFENLSTFKPGVGSNKESNATTNEYCNVTGNH